MIKDNYFNRLTDENYMIKNDNGDMVPNYDLTIISFNEGDILKGKVVKIEKDEVLIDVGYKSEGVIPISELSIRNNVKPEEILTIEDIIDIMVLQKEDQDGRLVLSKKRAEGEKSFNRVEEIFRNGETVEGERKEQRKEVLGNIEVGQIKNGVITSIADFGAFVDVDGIDGLIHISELSWNHVKHPSEVIKINDQVSVEVLDVDFDKQRLSLGLKQTQKDPWLEKIKKFKIKDVVQGKVTRIVKFGLFVQIETGMEGLVHISELSPEQVKRPSDVAKIGDELIVRIIDIDFDKRRMAFSVKQVEFPEVEEEKGKEEKGEVEKSEKPKSSKKADAKKA